MLKAPLKALLSDIVDYAGLFPPARLEFDEAIRNFARYRGEGDAWMLARFVCPVARLADLSAYRDSLFSSGPLRLAMLGRGGDDMQAFSANLAADAQAVRAWRAEQGAWTKVETFETALPKAAGAMDWAAMPDFLHPAIETLNASGAAAEPVRLFLEVSLAADWRADVAAAAEAVAGQNSASAASRMARLGLKVRTGGLEAAAFPTAEQVAVVLELCRDAGVPLKFTAGLHHPLRRFDAGVRTEMHGFLNVFAAAVLGHTLRLGHHDLRAILEDGDPRHFQCTEEFFGWEEAVATADEVRFARQHVATSFGSCSVDEPRDDLRELGWLEPRVA